MKLLFIVDYEKGSRPFAGDPALPWHPKRFAYRCFLPNLAGFTILRRMGLSLQQKDGRHSYSCVRTLPYYHNFTFIASFCVILPYFTPVLPNPPEALSDSESSESETMSTCSTRANTICAILSPCSIKKGSAP